MPRRAADRRHKRLYIGLIVLLFVFGGFFLWFASLRLPALDSLSDIKVSQSTKIYDRTGQVLLYDLSPTVSRSIVDFKDISPDVKNAVIAIEDKNFYNHGGVVFSSLLRAAWADLTTLSFSQGGSTITQQVVKNALLTSDKSLTRKLKEWILADKLEKVLTKDQILNLYLNDIPFGGKYYGVEEASENFFGVSAKNVTLPQAAYLAAIIEAPTYYSPYGTHRTELDARKNLVLKDMYEQGLLTEKEYKDAAAEPIEFKPRTDTSGIKAPHFVFFVIDQLTKKYGADALEHGGLKVITSLDYTIQAEAEDVAKQFGESNFKNFNANNNAIVVIDPKTGDIWAMVGSRDYWNADIEGNFNVATAHRQPGSTFKPFVYSTLFNKGYTPDTVLWDVPTQFNVNCAADNLTSDNNCYSPVDYDGEYRGPMTIRNALAQSINIPAIQALYLAGIKDSIDLAHSMGIEGLQDENTYGLTLVLGGGEVSPLDLTSAYSVFANDGVRNPYNAIDRVEDENGQVLEEYVPSPTRVLDPETARKITSILTDNVARTPAYGASSALYITDRPVAVKTGTTNNYKDAWIMGYAPNVAVGAWAGNTDNTPMDKKVAGFIVAPIWRALMDKILPNLPVETFPAPTPDDPTIKPILRGDWQTGGVHSILYWVDKDNPRGPQPSNPNNDPQFHNWETAVQTWASKNLYAPQQQVVFPTTQYNPYQNQIVPPGNYYTAPNAGF